MDLHEFIVNQIESKNKTYVRQNSWLQMNIYLLASFNTALTELAGLTNLWMRLLYEKEIAKENEREDLM